LHDVHVKSPGKDSCTRAVGLSHSLMGQCTSERSTNAQRALLNQHRSFSPTMHLASPIMHLILLHFQTDPGARASPSPILLFSPGTWFCPGRVELDKFTTVGCELGALALVKLKECINVYAICEMWDVWRGLQGLWWNGPDTGAVNRSDTDR
jgi:hypothetical protein